MKTSVRREQNNLFRNNTYSIVALLGICLLSITTYFYLFKFYETLFWFYQLDPLADVDSIGNLSLDAINDYEVERKVIEAERKVIPAKKPYFYIQFAQVIILFTYCYIKSRPKSKDWVLTTEKRRQISHDPESKPLSKVLLYIAGAFLILYIVIFLLGSIASYGMLG